MLSSFAGGVYLQWAISGHGRIRVTNAGGQQRRRQRAVPRPGQRRSPFVKTDTATKGQLDWHLRRPPATASSPASRQPPPSTPPSRPPGPSTYTWTTHRHRPPRPRRSPAPPTASPPIGTPPPASPSPSTSPTARPHNLELYFLDWDSTSRAETVQISDAASVALFNIGTGRVVPGRGVPGPRRQGSHRDHHHQDGRGERRAQRPLPRPSTSPAIVTLEMIREPMARSSDIRPTPRAVAEQASLDRGGQMLDPNSLIAAGSGLTLKRSDEHQRQQRCHRRPGAEGRSVHSRRCQAFAELPRKAAWPTIRRCVSSAARRRICRQTARIRFRSRSPAAARLMLRRLLHEPGIPAGRAGCLTSCRKP